MGKHSKQIQANPDKEEKMKRTKKEYVHVLTCDPSLTAFGWAIIAANSHVRKVIVSGCIKTAPVSKKLRIRKGDDRMRRVSEITSELLRIIDTYNVQHIVSELPHGSQSAVAAIALGLVNGLLQAVADAKEITIEWYSEQDAKRTVLNKSSCTKAEMIDAINSLFIVQWTGTKYRDEAVADALAIYYTAKKKSPIVKILAR